MFGAKRKKETRCQNNFKVVNFREYMLSKKHCFNDWEDNYKFMQCYESFTFEKQNFIVSFSQDLREHRVTLSVVANNEQIINLGFGMYDVKDERYDITEIQQFASRYQTRLLPEIDEEIDVYIEFLLKNKIIP